MEKEERAVHRFMATVAEQAERYDDMMHFMTRIIRSFPRQQAEEEEDGSSGSGLNLEELNLFRVAMANRLGQLRASWRILGSILQKNPPSEAGTGAAERMKEKVESELDRTCQECIDLIDDHLLPISENDAEARVHYLKMKGDMFRYMAEYAKGEERRITTDRSQAAYQAGYDLARTHMSPLNPTRLGLALTWSVLYSDMLGRRGIAVRILQQAFNDALERLEDPEEEAYVEDACAIMQLLRDNITLWTCEEDEDRPDAVCGVDSATD